jgi:drug/metabolite transporter (DMT)-like permease
LRPVRPWVLVFATLLLFTFWSNSFVTIGYLLGSEGVPRRFDWIGLTVARFLPAAAICALYSFGVRRAESLTIVRRYWRRLVLCGALSVPGYNLPLYLALQRGVPAPIASLTTTLVPLFVLILATLFLGERPTRRGLSGFAVAFVGMLVVSLAKRGAGGSSYPPLIALTALAPLSWSIYSVLSKPLAGRVSPILWTYLATTAGGLMVVPFLPSYALESWKRLDAPGWLALAYLALPCTVMGFALWTWLLKHLPASSVGFTVFLNPPMTTLSKYLLAAAFPATFVFAITGFEWLGGGLVLLGLTIALVPGRRR